MKRDRRHRDHWLGVELRHLAALEAVGRTRSFGAAARELGYTQSAISQQIARLEHAVGQRLVDRPGGPRRVDLTVAGQLLLRHADAIVAQLDAAQADMAALAEGAAGPLRVGIYQSVGARILPGLLRRFRREWPLVEVQVQEETDAAVLLRGVERGELDLTFAELPLPAAGPFESLEVLHDPYVLLVSSKSELAAREAAPRLRDLAGLPLIGWRTSGELDRFLAGRVPGLDVVFRTDDNGTLVGLVAEDLGAAVVPRLVVNPRNPAVVALPLGGRIPPRVLVIVWHRDRFRSAASQAFAGLARDLGAAYAERQEAAASARSSASAASTSRRPGR
jgi:DNA-binding transcriptional LysR family regulator